DGSKEESSSSGIDPMALFGSDTGGTSSKLESDNGIIFANNQNTESDAWNFLLVSLNKRGDIDAVNRALTNAGFNKESGYLIRDWSASVGGSARLAWFLQLMFNIGLIFVSFGAVIIVTNALLLSVLERTGEIGSLRAMGATRIRVSVMIFIETLLVVFGSALIGIFLGSFGIEWLNTKGLVIDNPYIKILFGGQPVRGDITVESIILHLTAAFLLTVVSMLYPLKRALGISPVEAMAE
ncbi:MAG: ABC transporter permease, partial [Spirochaetales bacterium]|nr:ABC transporter permease [Spirochaetales bacterium]